MESLKDIFYAVIGNVSILSIKFYTYLLVFIVLYYTIGKKLQWLLLLGASLFFYLANGRMAALWMFIPIAVTYGASLAVGKIDGRKKTLLTAFTVLFNVLFLIYFKEANFFIRLANHALAFAKQPLLDEVSRKAQFGISYLTLMLISYYLDVSWQTDRVQKNPLKFLTYILFFPITSSGPITRYAQLKSNLFETHSFDYEEFCFGWQRIIWGFFKKLVIADKISILVNNVYGNDEATGFIVLIGLLLFGVQMYFDFSGCMDMVLGIGKILGIALPENFTQPFYATSLSEFWRRWHITLGFWVKDYVLYPVLKSSTLQNLSKFLKKYLGKKNRYAKLIPTWCGMFITWFTVGFWHGGGWNYIFGSGLFFFFMIAGGQLLEPVFKKLIHIFHINTEHICWHVFQRLRTAFLFLASVSFDRAGFRHCLSMWKRVFTDFFVHYHGVLKNGISWIECAILFTLIIFEILVIERREIKAADNTIWLKSIGRRNIVLRWIVYYALIYTVVLFGNFISSFNSADFIYMGF